MKSLSLILGISLLFSACGQQPSLPLSAAGSAVGPTLLTARGAQAQQAGYHSTAILRIPQAGQIPQALAALRKLQAQTRAEAGNRAFVVHQDQQDPQTIVIWESFQDEAAFQAHLNSSHLQQFLGLNLVKFEKGYPLQPIE